MRPRTENTAGGRTRSYVQNGPIAIQIVAARQQPHAIHRTRSDTPPLVRLPSPGRLRRIESVAAGRKCARSISLSSRRGTSRFRQRHGAASHSLTQMRWYAQPQSVQYGSHAEWPFALAECPLNNTAMARGPKLGLVWIRRSMPLSPIATSSRPTLQMTVAFI